MTRETMIDYIMDNLCPYEMADTETSEEEARIQLETMSITELKKIYKEYKEELLI